MTMVTHNKISIDVAWKFDGGIGERMLLIVKLYTGQQSVLWLIRDQNTDKYTGKRDKEKKNSAQNKM